MIQMIWLTYGSNHENHHHAFWVTIVLIDHAHDFSKKKASMDEVIFCWLITLLTAYYRL